MKKQKIKVLSYGIYLLISISLLILLFMMRDQSNWVAGGLRELLTYTLIGLTIIFLLIAIMMFLKYRSKRTLIFGSIGIIPCLVAIPFFEGPVLSKQNSLSKKEEIIELRYIAWACDCANWATEEDLEKYSGNFDDSLAYHSIFIEPANQSLALPDTLNYGNDVIRFTGQFYTKRGFPKGYKSHQDPDKARVFRYDTYEVIESNYRKSIEALREYEQMNK